MKNFILFILFVFIQQEVVLYQVSMSKMVLGVTTLHGTKKKKKKKKKKGKGKGNKNIRHGGIY